MPMHQLSLIWKGRIKFQCSFSLSFGFKSIKEVSLSAKQEIDDPILDIHDRTGSCRQF